MFTLLVSLSLYENFWLGTIPDVFDNYVQLELFDIRNNLVNGPIPASLFSVPTLRLAYMSNCSLSGPIPPSYADPPLLRDLYLDGNRMVSGTVPAIGTNQLTALSEFLLQGTSVTGTMPASVCNLRIEHILDELWTDCGGSNPEIQCDFPDCCSRCFEGGTRRRRLGSSRHEI